MLETEIFAAGRQLGLSESDSAGLTLKRMRELVPDLNELSFVEAAKSPGQARAWVTWYWKDAISIEPGER